MRLASTSRTRIFHYHHLIAISQCVSDVLLMHLLRLISSPVIHSSPPPMLPNTRTPIWHQKPTKPSTPSDVHRHHRGLSLPQQLLHEVRKVLLPSSATDTVESITCSVTHTINNSITPPRRTESVSRPVSSRNGTETKRNETNEDHYHCTPRRSEREIQRSESHTVTHSLHSSELFCPQITLSHSHSTLRGTPNTDQRENTAPDWILPHAV